MNQLFIVYIRSFPYFGRVHYSAYKRLASMPQHRDVFGENPSFDHFKKFQLWELDDANRNEIAFILDQNKAFIDNQHDIYEEKWNHFRMNSKLKLPTVKSLTEAVGMFPTV